MVAAVLTWSTRTRRSELLNSLWTCGLRNYPVLGPFEDQHSLKLATAYSQHGKTKVNAFVTELYRKYRPDVVVTHDKNGEYGHGMHRMCADAALHCLSYAADPGKYQRSAEAWGVWQVRKLYLHLHPEHPIVMDWDLPLPSFGGRTGYEVALEGYEKHLSQHRYEQFAVEPRDSAYSSYRFGLAWSLVGPDERRDDFFENILPSPYGGAAGEEGEP